MDCIRSCMIYVDVPVRYASMIYFDSAETFSKRPMRLLTQKAVSFCCIQSTKLKTVKRHSFLLSQIKTSLQIVKSTRK